MVHKLCRCAFGAMHDRMVRAVGWQWLTDGQANAGQESGLAAGAARPVRPSSCGLEAPSALGKRLRSSGGADLEAGRVVTQTRVWGVCMELRNWIVTLMEAMRAGEERSLPFRKECSDVD